METKRFSRREFLRIGALTAAGLAVAACAPPAEPERVEVEVTREVPVEQIVEVEVEVPVKETVIVEATEEPAPAEPPPAPVEGNVVAMHFLHEFTEDHVNVFEEANPGITVEVIQADLTGFFAMYAAGSPPDLLRVQAPAIPQYLARKMLFDLTPFYEASELLNLNDLAPANDYYKGYSALDIGDGPIYGMCKDFSPDCTIFAYKPVFEEAGVDVPSDSGALSYQEIVEIASQLVAFEGDRTLVFGYDYERGWVNRFMMNMLAETDEAIFTPDLTKLVIADNEAAYAVAKYYYDLAADRLGNNPVTNPSPAGWNGTDFTQGIVGMMQYGFWFGAMAESEVTAGQVIMIPGPTWAGVRRDPTVTATGMIMAGATQVPEAAWRVFEYYNAEEPAIERAKSGWGVPALQSMYDLMPNETEYEQQKLRVLQGELALETSPLQFNPFLGETTVADSWNTHLDRSLQGEFDFDEMLTLVEEEVNAAIEDGVDRLL
jgi:multiple sugar transport system substrate-binding protein